MRRFNPILATVPAVAVAVPMKPECPPLAVNAPVSATSIEAVAPKPIETAHTKLKHKLFVVQISSRINRTLYERLDQQARILGGYYSKYRGDGAIPGFIFKTLEPAKTFLAEVQAVIGQVAPVKSTSASERISPNATPIPAWRRRIRA